MEVTGAIRDKVKSSDKYSNDLLPTVPIENW